MESFLLNVGQGRLDESRELQGSAWNFRPSNEREEGGKGEGENVYVYAHI